jgi:hypothetical protein
LAILKPQFRLAGKRASPALGKTLKSSTRFKSFDETCWRGKRPKKLIFNYAAMMKDMHIDDMMEMIDHNKLCRVYYNLHKGLFSVTQKNERNNWVVVAHVNHIELKKVKFIVSEAGRQRVLREKRKNVHAFLEGFLCNVLANGFRPRRITYNPYKSDSFMCPYMGIERVESSKYARLYIDWETNKPVITAPAANIN